MKTKILMMLAALTVVVGLNSTIKQATADVVQINFVAGELRYAAIAQEAGQWWNDTLAGWNPNLPAPVLSRLRTINVDVTVEDIDGVGGILGGANATDFLEYRGPSKYGQNIVLSQGGEFSGDAEDFELMSNRDIRAVMIHEIGHVLGFVIPEIAEPMGLTDPDVAPDGLGIVSPRALAAYRKVTGNDFATHATLEKFGGPGTRDVHPDSQDTAYTNIAIPGTNRTTQDIMIGFFGGGLRFDDEIALGLVMSEYAHDMGFITWRSGEDFFTPAGGNTGPTLGPNGPKNGGPPAFLRGNNSIPEPGSAVVIGVVAFGFGFVRRRRR